jgi:RHS repeat-associated protein
MKVQQTSYYSTTARNTLFSFSGKERDEESGYYSCFGARYCNSDLSIWFSVDLRANSYPSVTPYNYCMNSSVMYKDPNGKSMTALAVFGIIAAGLAGTYQGILIATGQCFGILCRQVNPCTCTFKCNTSTTAISYPVWKPLGCFSQNLHWAKRD